MAQALERVDPEPRSLTGASAGKVKNRLPDREYALANMTDDMFGAEALENDGWKYIISGSDKETVVGGRVIEGNKIAWRGQALMWRSKKAQEEHDKAKGGYTDLFLKRKQAPGGNDGVIGADGTPAEQFNPSKK